MAKTDDFAVPDFDRLHRLDDRVLVVAGAGLGIGRQTCHALASCGARVACVDVDGERADAVAAEVGGLSLRADVTKRAEVDDIVTEVEQAFGRLDGVVDIVGVAQWGPALEIDDETWDRQFDLCLKHAVYLAQAAAPRLSAGGGGTMVFIASVSGLDSAPNHAAYGAAKAGLMSWVRTLAVELGGEGIRVNAIAPGWIRTPRLEALVGERVTAPAKLAPLGRVGHPADIASAALFFSSDLSSYVTGRTLVVDGGVDCRFPYTS